MPDDEEVARILKRAKTPTFVAVNKMDTPGREDAIHEFWQLGLGEPYAVSATHGHGTGDLLDEVVKLLPEREPEPEADEIDIAIIGRPNAGKSSLLNRLAGRERSIVSDVAGTTRDAVDTLVERDGDAATGSSTPPACAGRPRSTRTSSTTASSARCAPSTAPTSRCS